MNSAPKTIIVAEDEGLIRMIAVDFLTDAGFAVIEAEHAADALAILTRRADSIDVLFTDVHMPGAMDGLALVRHARIHWPWVGLLVASGVARPGKDDLPNGSHFVEKPYAADRVVAHVREMVSA